MKDKILNVIMGISILALIGAGYREYLIHNGKLTSDLNANGYSITNLPAGFFPAETDPTVSSWAKEPTPPLPPGFAAVSNAAMTVGAAATNYTDAVAGQVRAAIPTNNAQLVNGAGYVTAAITNGLQLTETDPTVPAWAKAASAPLPPNYATVSSKAMSALQSYTETDPTVPAWAKAESKPTYTTSEISGLSTALAGKLDNGGGTLYGSLYFSGEDRDEWGFINLYNVGEYPGGMTIGYKTYGRLFLFNSYDASYNRATVILPADKDGTVAFTSDIPAVDLTPATNYTDAAIGAAITNTNPVFSNAVLSVGLGIDTNTVAAINALVEAGDELPIGGATSVGALLLALAAAVAALKRTKADASALRYAFAATIQPTAGTAAPTGTLTDRAENKVVCTEATGQTDANAKLTLTLPPAVPGYVRDFLVKIDRTTSGCYSVDFVPYGNESVSYETADGSMPEVPDGAVTWLSFTESESGGVFAVSAAPLVAVTGGV